MGPLTSNIKIYHKAFLIFAFLDFGSSWVNHFCSTRVYSSKKNFLSMDDERERPGVKADITTRDDDYLSKQFYKLSLSGHNITPMTISERDSYEIPEEQPYDNYLGYDQKGIYVCKLGGLPLFASGYRIDTLCNTELLYFSEPCDYDHIRIDEYLSIYCVRSGFHVGCIQLMKDDGTTDRKAYTIFRSSVRFYNIDSPWPIDSQPENYWGSEGQYRAWNKHEIDAKPLSY